MNHTADSEFFRQLSRSTESSAPSYIWTLGFDSNVVEVIMTLVFDVVLLGLIGSLCQRICSHYNLFRVYDSSDNILPLKSRHFAILGDGLIGVPWLSTLLTVILTVCVMSTIIIGFAVNGRAEPAYRHVQYGTVVGISNPLDVINVDFTTEYQDTTDNNNIRPTFISSRLVALQKIDYCQTCNYTHCKIFAYAYEDEVLSSSLVRAKESNDKYSATCVSELNFHGELVMAVNRREKQTDSWCGIRRIDVKYNGSSPLGIGMVSTPEYCHFKVSSMHCFRRNGHDTVCAALGTHENEPPGSTLKYLMVVRNQSKPEYTLDISRISLSRTHVLTNETWGRYLDMVAFMASIDLGPTFMLELMPFVSYESDRLLARKDRDSEGEREKNVSDIDLRLMIPGSLFVGVTLVVLVGVSLTTWCLFVLRKGRSKSNAFGSVTELVELVAHNQKEAKNTKKNEVRAAVREMRHDKLRAYVAMNMDKSMLQVTAVAVGEDANKRTRETGHNRGSKAGGGHKAGTTESEEKEWRAMAERGRR